MRYFLFFHLSTPVVSVLELTEQLRLLALHHLQLLRNGLRNDLRNDLRSRHNAPIAVRGRFLLLFLLLLLVGGTRLERFMAFRLRGVDKTVNKSEIRSRSTAVDDLLHTW